jgi:hypothetical protein
VPYLHCSLVVKDHSLVAAEPHYSDSCPLADSAMAEVLPDCLLPEPVLGTTHSVLVLLLAVIAVVAMLVFALVYPTGRSIRLYRLLVVR